MKSVPIVAVRDALQGFRNVAIVPNLDVGKRGFVNSCTLLLQQNNEDSLSVHDLSLYHVGDFDLESGHIEACLPTIVATPYTSHVSDEEVQDDSKV